MATVAPNQDKAQRLLDDLMDEHKQAAVITKRVQSNHFVVEFTDKTVNDFDEGHPDSEAVLLESAAEWLRQHPDVCLVSISFGYTRDEGHHCLTMVTDGGFNSEVDAEV
jgi:hypothetical protein